MKYLLICLILVAGNNATAQERSDTTAAHYPGGPAAWQRYLIKNLRINDSIDLSISSAKLIFSVSATGKISEVSMISGDPLNYCLTGN